MFWRKRKTDTLKEGPSLLALATKLGVERRFAVRVRYPQSARVCRLPEIYFADKILQVHDISTGGCCLLDPQQHLGPSIGTDIELNIHWLTGVDKIRARIISRVDHRRHIQFLNLSTNRQNQLTRSMNAGVFGLSMSRHASSVELGPTIQASELWSSAYSDSVVLENDVHRLAQIYLQGEQFVIFREAWPNKVPGGKCSRTDFEKLVLFLANIPSPTQGLKDLLTNLERQIIQGTK